MSAEERERGPEAGAAPPVGVASASEAEVPARPAEPAAANAQGDEPAASEPTARPGEAAPSDAPADELAVAAAPETTDTAPGEPAGGAPEAMPTASQPDLPAGGASDAISAASQPDLPAGAASDAISAASQPALSAGAASDAISAASQPGLPAVAGTRDGLGAADLRAVLAAVFPSGTPCRHWCARLDAIGPLAAGLPADLAAWTEGRAWSAGVELRWQQDGPDRYRALYLAEGDTLREGFVPLGAGLRALPGEAEPGLYLWGRRGDDGRYHATRLPRALDYPAAAGAPEVRLPYQRLVGPDGMVRFLRLTLGEES